MNYVVSYANLYENEMRMCEVEAVDRVSALSAGVSLLITGHDTEICDWIASLSDNFAYMEENEQYEHMLSGLFDCEILAGVFKID